MPSGAEPLSQRPYHAPDEHARLCHADQHCLLAELRYIDMLTTQAQMDSCNISCTGSVRGEQALARIAEQPETGAAFNETASLKCEPGQPTFAQMPRHSSRLKMLSADRISPKISYTLAGENRPNLYAGG